MDITQEQKEQVATWIAQGNSLSQIQSRLQNELGINMTFMEVRFLVDDLDLELQDNASSAKPAEHAPSAGASSAAATEVLDDHARIPPTQAASPESSQDAASAGLGGDVRISVDKLQRPGAVVSGDVTFSDGVSAGWQIDQMGRLGLIPTQEGYQPSPEDIAKFQEALQHELQSKGL